MSDNKSFFHICSTNVLQRGNSLNKLNYFLLEKLQLIRDFVLWFMMFIEYDTKHPLVTMNKLYREPKCQCGDMRTKFPHHLGN